MRESYLFESEGPISVIPLSTNGGTARKQKKGMWYVVVPMSKQNVI